MLNFNTTNKIIVLSNKSLLFFCLGMYILKFDIANKIIIILSNKSLVL